jgi:hypothetical protein
VNAPPMWKTLKSTSMSASHGWVSGECGADVEDTEKYFHVPATLLRALSAIDDVAETWKHFSASSMPVMEAWGLW